MSRMSSTRTEWLFRSWGAEQNRCWHCCCWTYLESNRCKYESSSMWYVSRSLCALLRSLWQQLLAVAVDTRARTVDDMAVVDTPRPRTVDTVAGMVDTADTVGTVDTVDMADMVFDTAQAVHTTRSWSRWLYSCSCTASQPRPPRQPQLLRSRPLRAASDVLSTCMSRRLCDDSPSSSRVDAPLALLALAHNTRPLCDI